MGRVVVMMCGLGLRFRMGCIEGLGWVLVWAWWVKRSMLGWVFLDGVVCSLKNRWYRSGGEQMLCVHSRAFRNKLRSLSLEIVRNQKYCDQTLPMMFRFLH